MDKTAMFRKINEIHLKTNKNKVYLFIDMIICGFKYGAGYMDYDLFEMYNLNSKQRDTYLTRGRNNKLITELNNKELYHFFNNKNDFNEKFNKFLKRDWIDFNNSEKSDVLEFIKRNRVFMAKPLDGMCGKRIEKIDLNDFENEEKVYDYLLGLNLKLELEEVIKQHKEVSAIHPNSINTVRMVTILSKNNNPNLVCAYFRIGNGKFVDNFNSGGMVAPVDTLTGIVSDKAIDKNKILYTKHPITNKDIKGFAFPDWEKAVNLVKDAALVIPEVRYIGWDVAFTPNGPVFVEGNEFPGHDIYQLPEHTPNKIGMMPVINKAIND